MEIKQTEITIRELTEGFSDNAEGGVVSAMSSLAALSLLVFSLLYTPCVAAVASVRRELGHKWALYVIIWQCLIAWIAALLVRLVGSLLGIV